MTPLLVLAVLVAVAFAVLFFQANNAKADFKAMLEQERAGQDGIRRELAEARNESAKLRARVDATEKEAAEARESSKKAKKKLADRQKETESLSTRVAELASTQSSYAGLDEARAEAIEARTEAANLRRRVQQLEAELGGKPRPAAPRPVEVSATVEASQPTPRPTRSDDDVALERARHREAVAALRASFDDQVRDERERARNEIDSLRRRLKKSLNDLDRERGRADNNDKAYAIVKGQLEAALDRLAEFDAGIRRPVVVPQTRPRRAEAPVVEELSAAPVEARPTAEAAAPAPVEAPPAAEAAAPAPVEVAPVEAPVPPVAPASDAAADDAPVDTAAVARPMAADLSAHDDGWDLDDAVISKLGTT